MPYPQIRLFYRFTGANRWWGHTENFTVDREFETGIHDPNMPKIMEIIKADLELALSGALGFGTGLRVGGGGTLIRGPNYKTDDTYYRIMDYTSFYLWVRDCCLALNITPPDPNDGSIVPPRQHSVLQAIEAKKRIDQFAGHYEIVLSNTQKPIRDDKPHESKVVIKQELPDADNLVITDPYNPSKQDMLRIVAYLIKDALQRIATWSHDTISFSRDNFVIVKFTDGTATTYSLTDMTEFQKFADEMLPLLHSGLTAKQDMQQLAAKYPYKPLEFSLPTMEQHVLKAAPNPLQTSTFSFWRLCDWFVTKQQWVFDYQFAGRLADERFSKTFVVTNVAILDSDSADLKQQFAILTADRDLVQDFHVEDFYEQSTRLRVFGQSSFLEAASDVHDIGPIIDYTNFKEVIAKCARSLGIKESSQFAVQLSVARDPADSDIINIAGYFDFIIKRTRIVPRYVPLESTVHYKANLDAPPNASGVFQQIVLYLQVIARDLALFKPDLVDFGSHSNCIIMQRRDGTCEVFHLHDQATLLDFLKRAPSLLVPSAPAVRTDATLYTPLLAAGAPKALQFSRDAHHHPEERQRRLSLGVG